MTICFSIAGFWFLIFGISFLYDRRLFRNSIFLVFALMFAGLGALFAVASVSRDLAELLAYGILFLIPVTIAVLAVFLVVNGVTMLRREGRRPKNLLSLAAGLGIFALVIFGLAVQQLNWPLLAALRTSIIGVLTYVSFLFVCFLIYAFVYSRIRSSRKIDFVIVLGSGLRGSRVPPLLASRLDRGKLVYDRAIRKGRNPMLITSGGQGPGEDIPESHAMATYLIERGVPADRILREDRSTSTTENLLFSRELMVARVPKYRCLIVTNNFHAFRAALTARKVKVNGQVVGSPTARYYWPTATIREFVAILFSHKWINGIICGVLFVIPFVQFA
ncbi:YdcF family protein [Kribbella albertanoniae]|uniref:YdcF family protein n=1 Tax=Kribbella albertanoniae TaxID=1266829 RepID=A0A4V2XPC6_9ACTN|nr:ElyC/SanA/YdcF family protein [Kribbella albertanoniae]TDC21515.1 YdcF family protein [Kribbella albertanoniae]